LIFAHLYIQKDISEAKNRLANVPIITRVQFLKEIPAMKSQTVSTISRAPRVERRRGRSFRLVPRFAAFLILVGLTLSSLYIASLAASSVRDTKREASVVTTGIHDARNSAGLDTVLPSARMARFGSFLAPPVAVGVSTFAADCTTPKTVFARGDTVCAQVSGALPGWQVIWSNANFVAVQTNTLTSGNQNVSFTLSSTASLGDWRVIIYEPFGGSVQTVTRFTVSDAQNPQVDVQVSKGQVSNETAAGSQVVFSIQVTNQGPDSAASVQLSDTVPANTKFVSFDQLAGPLFSCTNPAVGDTGTTVCTIAALAKGESAVFLATYLVDSGASAGSSIDNTATASNTVSDSNSSNDSSTASVAVASAPCVLTCPSNITQQADSGQAGAIVNYPAVTSTGDCGQPTTGENGETIPPISANPASGSFFPVGTTTVIVTSQTGGVCTFQVTVENPGGLSISITGANPLTVECGASFGDPGATAVNGTGQSVPVTVSGPTISRDTAPGTYTLTYTATEDTNSVSAERTVVVSDTAAPSIAVEGANPYKIAQGSCAAFTDPGATADDGCAGAKPVTTTISGPGGATSVDPNVPGTYTVTYTATDGTYSATATRTVLVGNFSEDEVDQPASANQPPTITLNCPTGVTVCTQTTIECGDTFTDLGATAAVCGGSVPVTTSGTVDRHTPGIYTINYEATANGFTTTATRTVTVDADNTAPTITLTGASPMTVECHTSFTDPGAVAHDACAGDFAATASGTVDANTVGAYVITYNATDPSGHVATAVTRTVNVVDTTAPVVTAPANVTVNTGSGAGSCSATVSDATLGTASANDSCAGSLSVTRSGVPSGNSFSVGVTTVTYSATDAAGNTASANQTVTVVDNTAPVLSCPANVTVYLPLNSTATSMAVSYPAATATDNCGGTVNNGYSLASGSVFSVGTTPVTVTATDANNNSASCTFTVTVLYDFTGFFSPVGNAPTLNSVNAGRAIPVKFSLSGNKGLDIFAADSPYSVSLNCDTNDPGVDVVETLTAGGSSLSYGPDQYVYVWKTESSWAGTCRQLIVKLNDGSTHVANFKFK
jgi:uncharacterized repeat protein (TIGR01451 family)